MRTGLSQTSYDIPTASGNIDFSMYDPTILPEDYFDGYFPSDPLYLGESFDFLAEEPKSNPMSRCSSASAKKSSPTPSLATLDRQYRLSPMPSQNHGYLSAPPLELVNEEDESDIILKRQRAARADGISACWTSPLCPNNTKDGITPDPLTCNGGCAPFLFDDGPLNDPTIDTALLNISIAAEDTSISPVEEKPRTSTKRNESVSSSNNASPTQNGRRQSKVAAHTKGRKPSLTKPSEESIVESIETPETKGKKRVPHNEVERKYRDSVNNQMECLRRVIPELQPSPRICDGADIEDLPAPTKPSKAIILASATAYIKKIEKDKKKLANDVEVLQARVRALQALVKCDDCSLMKYVMNVNLKEGKK
jgi:hypothetical protein